jgi:putative tryptophan/tyrosine transport system substrate-binding protein
VKRRDFITGLALAATMRSAEGRQRPKVYRIAIAHASALATDLTERSRGSIATPAILKALRRSGYIEGQNLLIERYSGEGRASHDPDLARDVVRRNPDLIIAFGNKLVLALKAATSTVPIVGVFGQPVEEGIVGSLARRAAISLGSLTVLVGAVGKAGPIVEANGTAAHPIGDR